MAPSCAAKGAESMSLKYEPASDTKSMSLKNDPASEHRGVDRRLARWPLLVLRRGGVNSSEWGGNNSPAPWHRPTSAIIFNNGAR